MAKFDVEIRKTIHLNFFLETETEEDAEKLAKEQMKGWTDLNTWREYQNEFEVIVMDLGQTHKPNDVE
jgi:hypothetical protein